MLMTKYSYHKKYCEQDVTKLQKLKKKVSLKSILFASLRKLLIFDNWLDPGKKNPDPDPHQCLHSYQSIGFILDGWSFHYAHIWGKSGISICQGIWLHQKSRLIRFSSNKTYFTS